MGPKYVHGWVSCSGMAVPDFIWRAGAPHSKAGVSTKIRPYVLTADSPPLSSHSSENKIFTLFFSFFLFFLWCPLFPKILTLDHRPRGSVQSAPCLPLPPALLPLLPHSSPHTTSNTPVTVLSHSLCTCYFHCQNVFPWLFPQWISSAPTSPF